MSELNVSIMSRADLLRWAKPATELETALLAELKACEAEREALDRRVGVSETYEDGVGYEREECAILVDEAGYPELADQIRGRA